jgi:uroporphyrinogen-III synthase
MTSAVEHASATLPLEGKRILVTRTGGQSGSLSRLIREHGGEPVEMPVIRIEPTPNTDQIDDAIERLSQFDWVLFTSANAVDALLDRMRERNVPASQLSSSRVAGIGKATARRLRQCGIQVDLMPDDAVGESMLDSLISAGVEGRTILLPRAEVARDILPDGLRVAGASVTVLPVYRTVPAEPDADVIAQLRRGEIDIVTFTSSSTVRNLIRMLDNDARILNGSVVACIGPVTAATARESDIRVDVVADEHSIQGLVEAICQWVGRSDR